MESLGTVGTDRKKNKTHSTSLVLLKVTVLTVKQLILFDLAHDSRNHTGFFLGVTDPPRQHYFMFLKAPFMF